MTRIILSGCNGKMGRVISDIVSKRSDSEIVCGIDINTDSSFNYPVFKSPLECDIDADVIIDFSNPAILSDLLKFSVNKKLPVVLATTGFSEEQVNSLKSASKIIPVFYSRNMSLGINVLIETAKKAAAVLEGFDIEIVEKHHNQKIDAPSGTALMIADAVSDIIPGTANYMYDRHSQRKKRGENEIGIHAIRGGTIVGEHDIIFAGRDEIVTISHSALSKDVFAVGSVNAALFISKKQNGLYDMSDLLASK